MTGPVVCRYVTELFWYIGEHDSAVGANINDE